ncbi:MAG: hypothetical protein JSW33_07005 [bacterium]|nr:MAG: hypothetical protein JSW33_07005 [bacterium]
MKFKFNKIYIDSAASEDEITKNVLSEYADVPREFIQDVRRLSDTLTPLTISEGKKILWLTHFKGKFLKPCPGTAVSYLCCNYLVINEATNCPIDCTYCILQDYINNPVMTVYTNVDQIITELRSLSRVNPNRILRVGTGELTDSLALDPVTGLSKKLIYNLRFFPQILLELKTKTDHVDHLLNELPSRVVFSWSVNPQTFIKLDERKSSSLRRRLEAAKKAMDAGFLIGLHFDPIVYSAKGIDSYIQLIDFISTYLDENRVAWISLGSLRFPPSLKPVIQTRFPESKILTGESISGKDGKTRYIKPLRIRLYKEIVNSLRKKWDQVFVYFCMESRDIWEKVLHLRPEENLEVDWLFARSLYDRFPELQLPKPERPIYNQPIQFG